MWTKTREEIVEIVVRLVVERNCPLENMAMHMAQQFYMGRSRPHAAAKLAPILSKAVGEAQYAAYLDKSREVWRMEETLRAEGWEWRDDPTGVDAGLWYYVPEHKSVNRQGGFFSSREEATRVTFGSATRALINGKVRSNQGS